MSVFVHEPELAELSIADPADAWRDLGFKVDAANNLDIGNIRIRLGVDGDGITSWSFNGANAMGQIDGLNTPVPRVLRPPPFETHPNGATGLDAVVVMTGDFDRTSGALSRAGIDLKRTEDSERGRLGFRRIGPVILELVQRAELAEDESKLWGVAIVVVSLEELGQRLGGHLGEIRPAVQRGRRIATLNSSAGLSTSVAFMSPEL